MGCGHPDSCGVLCSGCNRRMPTCQIALMAVGSEPRSNLLRGHCICTVPKAGDSVAAWNLGICGSSRSIAGRVAFQGLERRCLTGRSSGPPPAGRATLSSSSSLRAASRFRPLSSNVMQQGCRPCRFMRSSHINPSAAGRRALDAQATVGATRAGSGASVLRRALFKLGSAKLSSGGLVGVSRQLAAIAKGPAAVGAWPSSSQSGAPWFAIGRASVGHALHNPSVKATHCSKLQWPPYLQR